MNVEIAKLLNTAVNTDSYKYSHYRLLPPSLQYATSYGEARSDAQFERWLWNGLQPEVMDWAPLAMDDVEWVNELAMRHCGNFNYEGFKYVVENLGGWLPIRIQALPEGMIVPTRVPMYQVTTTEPGFAWAGQFVEAAIQRAAWYATTVGTVSWHMKHEVIMPALERSCDSPQDQIMYRMHDFGARGASSVESAMRGGMAHLINFNGSDTVPALVGAKYYYGEPLAAFNIPALEHFVVMAWGRDGEVDCYRNAIREVLTGPGTMLSIPPDAYDFRYAVECIFGQVLKDEILRSGGTLVVRPDSGIPVEEVLFTLRSLDKNFGSTFNSKGYRVLNPSVRIIQGDGMDLESARELYAAILADGYSAENVAIGMGGGLLQKVDRGMSNFAQKGNAITSGHTGWIGIRKEPKTDMGKASKLGRRAVVLGEDGQLTDIPEAELGNRHNYLEPIWDTGKLLRRQTLAQMRELSNQF